MNYTPEPHRYETMSYRRCGDSGIQLPAISLGMWHNFGGNDIYENGRAMVRRAFDLGICHFDLANNYGPPPGSAEESFGRILRQDFGSLRDELLISTKAGWGMWPGPFGDFGSRKYLVASLDQSLKRMGLDYVDIFYHHRPDPNTPLEETMKALDFIVRSGRALYVGISQYNAAQTRKAGRILKDLGTPCLIHQPKYSMFERWIEDGLCDVLDEMGMGSIVFSPLAQGMLTNRYLNGIPADSRVKKSVFLTEDHLTDTRLAQIRALNDIAAERGQTLAQMAVAWVLRIPTVTSALIGASRVSQIDDIAKALSTLAFTDAEIARIDALLKE